MIDQTDSLNFRFQKPPKGYSDIAQGRPRNGNHRKQTILAWFYQYFIMCLAKSKSIPKKWLLVHYKLICIQPGAISL